MSDLVDELIHIKGYSYQVWNYQLSHSVLTIRATHEQKKHHNIHITFGDVRYFQFPLGWDGDFYPAADDEFIEIIKRTDLMELAENLMENAQIEILKRLYSLYKADSPGGVIYILGKLVDIENDVEPIYN